LTTYIIYELTYLIGYLIGYLDRIDSYFLLGFELFGGILF